jgi:hypothetical protein
VVVAGDGVNGTPCTVFVITQRVFNLFLQIRVIGKARLTLSNFDHSIGVAAQELSELRTLRVKRAAFILLVEEQA